MAQWAVREKTISIRVVCQAFGNSPTCYRYQAKLSSENGEIADCLIRLTTNQRNWGFGLCFLYLGNVKGYGWNHKRMYRIYRALELNLRIKPKKRLVRGNTSHWPSLPQSTRSGRWTSCTTSSQMAAASGCSR